MRKLIIPILSVILFCSLIYGCQNSSGSKMKDTEKMKDEKMKDDKMNNDKMDDNKMSNDTSKMEDKKSKM